MRSLLNSGAILVLAIAVSASSVAGSNSANDLLVSGHVDEALKLLNSQVQSTPNNAEAYHLLSRSYFHLKKWDQAIANGEKAVQLAPNVAEYYIWLGRAYGEKADDSNPFTAAGLAGKIRGSFEKAVQLDSNNVKARTDLAEYYVEAPGFMGGGTDKAAAQAKEIAQKDPARAHWVNAKIAEKKKDFAGAEREFNEAIRIGQSADYWLNLASFYRRRNRMQDMENAITKAMAASKKKSSDYYDAATLLYRAGRNMDGAADLLRKYLASTAPNEEAPAFQAHYLLGEIMEKTGNKAEAANEYRAALQLASSYSPAREGLKRVS
jgi:tetratricopeptide (TPR) repeat protein